MVDFNAAVSYIPNNKLPTGINFADELVTASSVIYSLLSCVYILFNSPDDNQGIFPL